MRKVRRNLPISGNHLHQKYVIYIKYIKKIFIQLSRHTNVIFHCTSQKRTKKETVTKSRKTKALSSEDRGSKSHAAAVFFTPESDSDSDSSLDVEKWTRLVSQLSGVI